MSEGVSNYEKCEMGSVKVYTVPFLKSILIGPFVLSRFGTLYSMLKT